MLDSIYYCFPLAHSTLTKNWLSIHSPKRQIQSCVKTFVLLPSSRFQIFSCLIFSLHWCLPLNGVKASKSFLTTLHKTIYSLTFNNSFLFRFVFLHNVQYIQQHYSISQTIYLFIDSFLQNTIPMNQGFCSAHCSISGAQNTSCAQYVRNKYLLNKRMIKRFNF